MQKGINEFRTQPLQNVRRTQERLIEGNDIGDEVSVSSRITL